MSFVRTESDKPSEDNMEDSLWDKRHRNPWESFKHYSNKYGRPMAQCAVVLFVGFFVVPTCLGLFIRWFDIKINDANLFGKLLERGDLLPRVGNESLAKAISKSIWKGMELFGFFLFVLFGKPIWHWLMNKETDNWDSKKNSEKVSVFLKIFVFGLFVSTIKYLYNCQSYIYITFSWYSFLFFLLLFTKLAWTRLNFSLNILETLESGDLKVNMRTINEDSLRVIFTNKMDTWLFANLCALKGINKRVGPFLSLRDAEADMWTSVGDEFFKNAVAKCRDQVINRVSTLFGSGFIGQDLRQEVVQAEYIFGVTYEKQTDLRNRKVRVLLMKKDDLETMMRESDINGRQFEHDRRLMADPMEKTSKYARDRTIHLKKMYKIYFNRERGKERSGSSESGTIIGRVFIASQGHLQ